MHRITSGFIALVALWGVGIFITCASQCRPLAGFWDPRIDAACIDMRLFFNVNQVFNVVTEIFLLVLPFPIIRKLKQTRRTKLALSGVFLLGGL